jgi:hypothetical protein
MLHEFDLDHEASYIEIYLKFQISRVSKTSVSILSDLSCHKSTVLHSTYVIIRVSKYREAAF